MGRVIVIFLLVIGIGQPCSLAQSKYLLQWNAADSSYKIGAFKNSFATRVAAQQYLEQLPSAMQAKGYLAFSIDSVRLDSLAGAVFCFFGQPYVWKNLRIDSASQHLLEDLNSHQKINSRKKNKLIANPTFIRDQLLSYFENHGYPFASVGFDSISAEGNQLTAHLVVNKGPTYKIDSIGQMGSIKLKSLYLQRLLQIPKGSLFNQEAIDDIAKKLSNLPFVTEMQPSQLIMTGTGAAVTIFLAPKKSNVFNALIGLMPASNQTIGNKLLVTGDVNVLLKNSFRSGETIGFNWQQIQYQSPKLNLQFNQPYLLGNKTGIDFSFELFKKDSQFVNLRVQAGIPYAFNKFQNGKALFVLQQTNVTLSDTNYVLKNKQLPDLAAVSSSSFAIDYQWNNTNYQQNPSHGVEFNGFISAGIKKITPANDILQLKDPDAIGKTFAYLYDSLQLSTYLVRLSAKGAAYFKMGGLGVLKTGLAGGWVQSGNYFRNELFQIGGFKLLRGFDEESIFATHYAVGTLEYRIMTGKEGYFFGFSDIGYAKYKVQQISIAHNYVGAGVGLAVATKNSLINISWAVGKRNDQVLSLRQAKIHLGLVNFF